MHDASELMRCKHSTSTAAVSGGGGRSRRRGHRGSAVVRLTMHCSTLLSLFVLLWKYITQFCTARHKRRFTQLACCGFICYSTTSTTTAHHLQSSRDVCSIACGATETRGTGAVESTAQRARRGRTTTGGRLSGTRELVHACVHASEKNLV